MKKNFFILIALFSVFFMACQKNQPLEKNPFTPNLSLKEMSIGQGHNEILGYLHHLEKTQVIHRSMPLDEIYEILFNNLLKSKWIDTNDFQQLHQKKQKSDRDFFVFNQFYQAKQMLVYRSDIPFLEIEFLKNLLNLTLERELINPNELVAFISILEEGNFSEAAFEIALQPLLQSSNEDKRKNWGKVKNIFDFSKKYWEGTYTSRVFGNPYPVWMGGVQSFLYSPSIWDAVGGATGLYGGAVWSIAQAGISSWMFGG